MKLIKNVCTCILLLCLGFVNVYAQQERTAYEKKELEITRKYFKQLTILNKGRWTQQDENTFNMVGTSYLEFGIAALFIDIASSKRNEAKKLIDNMEAELKQAEKLKTEYDFDSGRIKRAIKAEFEKWNKKGEFEKASDYEERLKTQSQKEFTRICTEEIQKYVGKDAGKKIKMELSTYNSENESYNVSFKFYDVKWSSKLMVPIANAQQIKENWSKFASEIDIDDWCFVDNNLCPKQVVLSESIQRYEFLVPLRNQRDIIYSFDNLGITNAFLKGFRYNYTDARKIERERLLQEQRERERIELEKREKERIEREKRESLQREQREQEKKQERIQKEKDDALKKEMQLKIEKNAKNNTVVYIKGKKVIEHETVELITEDPLDRYWFFVIGWGGYFGVKAYDSEKGTVKSVLYRTYRSYKKVSKDNLVFENANEKSRFSLNGKTGKINKYND